MWGHGLEDVSNAGVMFSPFNASTNLSIFSPQDPFHPFQNMYGNADYDIRHYFSANYVYSTPKNVTHGVVGRLLGDWTVAGTVFAHTGTPFTVVDSGTGGALAAYGYGATGASAIFANQTGGGSGPTVCGSQYANAATNGPCPGLVNNFVASPGGFGDQRRNQVRGPNFFNTDLSIFKTFKVKERFQFTVGATAYNLFNHPNFDQPVGDVASPQFGSIVNTVSPPTSIYGAMLGADASPRLLQSQIKLSF